VRIDRRKLTLLLVLVIGLGGVCWFVSREEQSVATPVARGEKSVRDAAPSHSGTSLGRQAEPAQLVDTSGSISSRTHEPSVPASNSVATPTASATAPGLNPVALRSTVAEEIPQDWGITGNNTEGYELRTDRAVVLSRSASAVLESHADTDTSRFGALVQGASAAPFRGKRLELSGYIAAVDAPAGASIWLRADDATATTVAFDNSAARGIRGTAEWTYQNIVIEIPKEALALLYGAVLNGRGRLYVDDLQFRVVDESVPLTAKPIAQQRSLARGHIVDPGREPRNLDFEQTSFSQ
jgi:hypothetical protein